jgi:hypothetical protein
MTPALGAPSELFDAMERGVMLFHMEPFREASRKRLFCKIFSSVDYFMLNLAIKINFVKIVKVRWRLNMLVMRCCKYF